MTKEHTSISTLHNLLDFEAGKFASAEIQLRNALKDWTNMANSLKLKTVFQKYQEFIQKHLENFEVFFEEEKLTSMEVNNKIMQTFIEEINHRLELCTDAELKDVCLLAGIQEINHFKIYLYGTAAAFARTLELDKAAGIFHEAEVNEKQIDDRLSQLAKFEVNLKAKSPIVIP
jgi:ferritin-like metal-binding protein YciE